MYVIVQFSLFFMHRTICVTKTPFFVSVVPAVLHKNYIQITKV